MKYSWELSKFDTAILGWKTAKITYLDDGNLENLDKTIQKLIEELKQNGIKYLTYRFPAKNMSLLQHLERAGFQTVDIIIGLMATLAEPLFQSEESKDFIRPAKKNDLSDLKKIVQNLFLLTRFYQDPLIPISKANMIYEQWIENSLMKRVADEMFVWEDKGKIQGFITLQHKGHIPLIGVAKEAQGQGIAKTLLQYTLNHLAKLNVKNVQIETQSINIAALRAYQQSGFKVNECWITVRWASENLKLS